MKIQLSEHFTYSKLIRFTIPSVIMMIFTSIYGVVDGIFVSNFVGKTPFAAINLIMPFLMLFGAIGFMIGAGGSALVSMTLGAGERDCANQRFSMLIYVTAVLGAAAAAVAMIFLRPVSRFLGAEGEMLEYCVQYGRLILPALPAFMLQNTFQSFLITAEKPQLGLYVTVAAGVTNMTLDALFIAVFKWGLAGAAIATAISQMIGGVIPLIYFCRKNTSLLRLGKCSLDGKALLKTCTNGSSEFMTNVSLSLVNMLYNFQLMRFAGEDGVAAYGVIMYANFIFIAIYIGYSIGTAPIIGFHYGAQNHAELNSMYTKSLRLLTIVSMAITVVSVAASGVLSGIFVSYDPALHAMTHRGFMLYSLAFLFLGINIFASSFFTALGNGLVSAVLSFLRTLLFQAATLIIMPEILGIDGIWLSIVAAELMALGMSVFFFKKMRPRYRY